MANLPGPSSAAATSYRPHKWLFDKQEMKQVKSVLEGFPEEKELEYRQRATRFIQEMVDRLNEQVKDKCGKVTQLCVCAASIHMHRFYYFHSFKLFDYRDIAAACLFLSGKSEESPRKLDSIVHVWWAMKFPKYPRFSSNTQFADARQLLVQLENVILQTIAFDLKIDLPHPVVLSLTANCIGHVVNDHANKKLTECAYFFATDVLCVTNWAIRYSAAEIAVCCVHIVSIWSQHEIPTLSDRPWYGHVAKNMTKERLQEMVDEFLKIYDRCKGRLALHKFVSKGMIRPPSESYRPNESTDSLPSLLPPPPQPPQMRMDSNESKDRNRSLVQSQRRSFVPDTTPSPMPGIPSPQFVPGNPQLVERRRTEQHMRPEERQQREEEQRRREKEKRREERRREERPEERERRKDEERKRKDEERRKRDHDRVSGQQGEPQHAIKKPRTDGIMQQFVAASNDMFNGIGKDRLSLPSMKLDAPVSPLRAPPALMSCRFVGMPPPPLPPSILSPPPIPPKNDLEEGEVE